MNPVPAPIVDSGVKVIDQFFGQSFSISVLVLGLGLSLFFNYLQFRRNNSLVDQLLQLVPNMTAKVLEAVAKFQEVVNELREKD